MDVDELINKLYNINELINRNDLSVKTAELSNELLETLKIIENCTSCKDKKIDGNDLDKCLVELEKEQGKKKEDIIYRLNNELNKIDFELNKKEILCESCKEKKIEKLTDKCGNEEIARFLYQCKLNAKYYNDGYIQWIPFDFDEFENIECLAKGSFGKVYKATWINGGYEEVVLKRIYNSNDKIVDILNEVK